MKILTLLLHLALFYPFPAYAQSNCYVDRYGDYVCENSVPDSFQQSGGSPSSGSDAGDSAQGTGAGPIIGLPGSGTSTLSERDFALVCATSLDELNASLAAAEAELKALNDALLDMAAKQKRFASTLPEARAAFEQAAAELEAAQSELDAAEAAFAEAQTGLAAAQQNGDGSALASAQAAYEQAAAALDEALSARDAAQSQYDAAALELTQAESDLEDAIAEALKGPKLVKAIAARDGQQLVVDGLKNDIARHEEFCI